MNTTKLEIGIPLTGLTLAYPDLFVSGGGGESKTGVPNQIIKLDITNCIFDDKIDKYEEEAVMYPDLDISRGENGVLVACSADFCTVVDCDDGIRKGDSFPVETSSEFMLKSVRFNDAGLLAIAASDGVVRLFEGQNLIGTVALEDCEGDLLKAEWIDDDRMVVLKRSGAVVVNVANDVLAMIEPTSGCRFNGVKASPDGRFLYFVQFEPRVASYLSRYDVETGTMKNVLIDKRVHGTSVSVSYDGQYVVVGDAKGYVLVYKGNLGLFMKLKVHDFVITNCQMFTVDQQVFVASVSLDEHIALTEVVGNMSYARTLLFVFSVLVAITAILYSVLV